MLRLHYGEYDFKLAVKSTHILLDFLPKDARKPNLAERTHHHTPMYQQLEIVHNVGNRRTED